MSRFRLPALAALLFRSLRAGVTVLVVGLLGVAAASWAGLLVVEQGIDPTQVGPGPVQWIDYHVDTPWRTSGLFVTECDDNSGESRGTLRSELVLYEDGRRLGPDHSFDDAIRDAGRGAYSYRCLDSGASRGLAFSASDNSDPRGNGRHYRVSYPIKMAPTLVIGTLALFVILVQRQILSWVYERDCRRPLSPSPALSRWEVIVMALVGLSLTILWTLGHGQSINWDQKNYHIYVAYSWLHDRTHVDIGPAQGQGWMNPLPYLPYYFAIEYLRPIWAGIVIGIFPAINFVLVYAIGWMMFSHYSRLQRHTLVFLAALVGVTGPIFLSEVSTTYIDNTACIPLLAALGLAIRSLSCEESDRRLPWLIFGMGLFLGLALGFKLTHGPFAVGLAAAFLVCGGLRRVLVRVVPLGLLGAGVGFGLGGGYPAFLLWEQYGNPLLPMFNTIFRAPLFPPIVFIPYAVIPHSFAEALAYPVSWFQGGMVTPDRPFCLRPFGYQMACLSRYTAESPFYDCRFLLIHVLIILTALITAIRAVVMRAHFAAFYRAALVRSEIRSWLFLTVFCVVSYGMWLLEFGLSRYLVALELVSGVLLMVGLSVVFRRYRHRVLAMTACTVFSVAWTQPMDWSRVPYGQTWFDLSIPAPLTAPNTLFVMVSEMAFSYIIPSFPEDARFIRLSSTTLFLEPDAYLGQVAFQEIAAHRGPVWMLTAMPLNARDRTQLARFHVDVDFDRCLQFSSNSDRFTACPATTHRRSEGVAPQASGSR